MGSGPTTLMISFAFRGTIADIDETTPDEPGHPATVLIIEVAETFSRVVVPAPLLNGYRELLCAERPVQVLGDVQESERGLRHVATLLRLVGPMH
jgi:hypothetical protein